jgi:hypothetical protein
MGAADNANDLAKLSEMLGRMSPGTADLLSRMMKLERLTLFDVRPLRDEIVQLNTTAQTDEEQSALLFAFNALMDRTETIGLDRDALERLKGLRKADYLMMLNVQATRGDLIDPDRLEAVTRREVEAGRMAADDEFRRLSIAGASVLGKRLPSERRSWFQRLFGRK